MSNDVQFLRAPQPMPEWRKLLEICGRMGIDPLIVTCPSKYREGKFVVLRKKVLKALKHEEKLSVVEISLVCPLSQRRIREAVDA